jgi:MFS family permease
MIGLPLSSVIGGPLSGWIIGHFDHMNGWRGWQWLFFLEAIPSVLLGILTFWALPNNYQSAKWLSNDEKSRLAADLAADDAEGKGVKHSFKDGFFNLKVWMLGGIDFHPVGHVLHQFLDAVLYSCGGCAGSFPDWPDDGDSIDSRCGGHVDDWCQLGPLS